MGTKERARGMKTFGGAALFLDRGDINTDEIIPAKYLTENSKAALKPYCLEDLRLPGFDPRRDLPGKGVAVTRGNFGCGSSREHAPWALEANGINLVIGESFARIFRQNMYNCGMIAVELPKAELDAIFAAYMGKSTRVEVDYAGRTFVFSADGFPPKKVAFALNGFEAALVEAGGWLEFAAKRY
jgi:3-isopropylmalate/(R)-2-methylmalate dehydratase small subunit